jgi:predicted nucleic acid-binding protein
VAHSIVVDANVMVSALLGGVAREVLFAGEFGFYSTQNTLFEVAKYLPVLAARLGLGEQDLFREYELLPIIACQPDRYESHLAEAARMIGGRDPKDVPIVALAIALACPVWTEDRDFDGLSGVAVRRTTDLLSALPRG